MEIETFCLDFNKIKEATALYKLIKTLVSGEWKYILLKWGFVVVAEIAQLGER